MCLALLSTVTCASRSRMQMNPDTVKLQATKVLLQETTTLQICLVSLVNKDELRCQVIKFKISQKRNK